MNENLFYFAVLFFVPLCNQLQLVWFSVEAASSMRTTSIKVPAIPVHSVCVYTHTPWKETTKGNAGLPAFTSYRIGHIKCNKCTKNMYLNKQIQFQTDTSSGQDNSVTYMLVFFKCSRLSSSKASWITISSLNCADVPKVVNALVPFLLTVSKLQID